MDHCIPIMFMMFIIIHNSHEHHEHHEHQHHDFWSSRWSLHQARLPPMQVPAAASSVGPMTVAGPGAYRLEYDDPTWGSYGPTWMFIPLSNIIVDIHGYSIYIYNYIYNCAYEAFTKWDTSRNSSFWASTKAFVWEPVILFPLTHMGWWRAFGHKT